MKRRNAESGKMRRPVKRTKITEGMYGNSLLYLKFVLLWATVVLADYMLEFRFEFLWPFWMMLRSVYDSFKYQGLAFSMFFICIALTSDMICFFFIPVQYIFFAASTYVWVQYVWYTFADKGVCVPTAALCCLVVYAEGALRGERLQPWRPLAAHCVGYPAVTLGFSVKSYVGRRLRLRTQRHVRRQNDFYFQLMRDALPESALDQSQQQPPKEAERSWSQAAESPAHANMNGSAGRRRCGKPELNGHCVPDIVKVSLGHHAQYMNGSAGRRRCGKPELNGHCVPDIVKVSLGHHAQYMNGSAGRRRCGKPELNGHCVPDIVKVSLGHHAQYMNGSAGRRRCGKPELNGHCVPDIVKVSLGHHAQYMNGSAGRRRCGKPELNGHCVPDIVKVSLGHHAQYMNGSAGRRRCGKPELNGHCVPDIVKVSLGHHAQYMNGSAGRRRCGKPELNGHCVPDIVKVSLGHHAQYMNGSAGRRRCGKPELNGHCVPDIVKVSLGHHAQYMNGSAGRRRCGKPELNGHCVPDIVKVSLGHHAQYMNGSAGRRRCGKPELNGHCVPDIVKLEKQSRDKSATHTHAHSVATSVDDERSDAVRGVIKSSRCDKKEASTLKEEKRRSKNKDKDKESSDSHKSTEQTQVVKEVESTKESVKNKECNGYKEKDKEKEREREAKEREREREKERERELREARSCSEELKRVRAELAAALRSEQDARRALAAAAANDRQRRADLAQLRHAHHALQHKVSTWRGTNSTSERRAGDERRGSRASREAAAAAAAAAAGARQARTMSGDCDSARCAARRAALDADAAGLRVELQRVRDTLAVVQRDLAHANEQLEAAKASAAEESAGSARLAALQDRAAHLQRSLSAETRVKLDLLSALGGAKRHILIQDGTISRQEKEIEELKAQMLAVMPTEYVTVGSGTSKLRLETQLDPNASVYTPKQLCSDA
ncbi:macoilin [Achroia grisella]|uniref:macoilin n=1 Tax=Achroia grisella TaxID=688607 RepID=UPI0027D29F72|nr:macoilin [Achroia grisella]